MSRDLDGTLEEFPHREVAMAAYRKIWLTYRTLDQDSAAAAQLEKQMDENLLWSGPSMAILC